MGKPSPRFGKLLDDAIFVHTNEMHLVVAEMMGFGAVEGRAAHTHAYGPRLEDMQIEVISKIRT